MIRFKTYIICFAACLLSFISTVRGQHRLVSANTILNNAKQKANSSNKKILLMFGASWNPWSEVLDSLINRGECKQIFHKYYIFVSLKAKERNIKLKKQTEVSDELFSKYFDPDYSRSHNFNEVPTVFVLNKDLIKLKQYTAFPEKFEIFTQMLKSTSLITDNELKIIQNSFTHLYKKVGAPTADSILNNALNKAKAEQKKVLLIFHASWCHWCHVLDSAINYPTCKALFDNNFVICHLVVNESSYKGLLEQNVGAQELLEKYQGAQRGIPFSVIFDGDGKLAGSFIGFPAPQIPEDYDKFENTIRSTTNLSNEQLNIIKDAFNKVGEKNGLN